MHQRGFAHRDLKPWNVMLSDDLVDAKVIDFSYSTPLKAKDISDLCPKLRGYLSGTKYYMAPEQFN
jgi:serine/threonine protein kinase